MPEPINKGYDAGLGALTQGELIAEVVKLRNALRAHWRECFDSGDWIATYDLTLWEALPEVNTSVLSDRSS